MVYLCSAELLIGQMYFQCPFKLVLKEVYFTVKHAYNEHEYN